MMTLSVIMSRATPTNPSVPFSVCVPLPPSTSQLRAICNSHKRGTNYSLSLSLPISSPLSLPLPCQCLFLAMVNNGAIMIAPSISVSMTASLLPSLLTLGATHSFFYSSSGGLHLLVSFFEPSLAPGQAGREGKGKREREREADICIFYVFFLCPGSRGGRGLHWLPLSACIAGVKLC